MPERIDYQALALERFNADRFLWQEAFVEACPDHAKPDSKKKRFRGVVEALTESGRVSVNDDGSYTISLDS